MNVIATEKNKTRIIYDSHLAKVNKISFRTVEEEESVIFTCFQGANTRQLCCTHIAGKPLKARNIILYIRSSDNNKINYDNFHAEDQRTVNI